MFAISFPVRVHFILPNASVDPPANPGSTHSSPKDTCNSGGSGKFSTATQWTRTNFCFHLRTTHRTPLNRKDYGIFGKYANPAMNEWIVAKKKKKKKQEKGWQSGEKRGGGGRRNAYKSLNVSKMLDANSVVAGISMSMSICICGWATGWDGKWKTFTFVTISNSSKTCKVRWKSSVRGGNQRKVTNIAKWSRFERWRQTQTQNGIKPKTKKAKPNQAHFKVTSAYIRMPVSQSIYTIVSDFPIANKMYLKQSWKPHSSWMGINHCHQSILGAYGPTLKTPPTIGQDSRFLWHCCNSKSIAIEVP